MPPIYSVKIEVTSLANPVVAFSDYFVWENKFTCITAHFEPASVHTFAKDCATLLNNVEKYEHSSTITSTLINEFFQKYQPSYYFVNVLTTDESTNNVDNMFTHLSNSIEKKTYIILGKYERLYVKYG